MLINATPLGVGFLYFSVQKMFTRVVDFFHSGFIPCEDLIYVSSNSLLFMISFSRMVMIFEADDLVASFVPANDQYQEIVWAR